MKKFFIVLFCVVISLSLFGCEDVTKKPEGEIAYIGYYRSNAGDGYLAAVTRALDEYTLETGKEYTTYQLRDIKKDTFISTLDLAIKTGASTFIIPHDFHEILMEIHKNYYDCHFIVLDSYIDASLLGDVENVFSTNFNSYETGYVAGYLLSLEELSNFAYASNFSNRVEERYLSGILQGMEDGCKTIEVVDGKKKKNKSVNFDVYDFQGVSIEDIETTVAFAYQSKVDVFFYLGSALYDVIDDYTSRSGFEYVAYCANDLQSNNDIITIRIDYSALLKNTLSVLDRGENIPTNMIFGVKDGVQSFEYDMNYLSLATERIYFQLRDQLLSGDLSLFDNDKVTWDKLKLKNVKVEKVAN